MEGLDLATQNTERTPGFVGHEAENHIEAHRRHRRACLGGRGNLKNDVANVIRGAPRVDAWCFRAYEPQFTSAYDSVCFVA